MMTCLRRLAGLARSGALILALHAGWCPAESVKLEGPDIRLDDGLFTGCFHDAFEGKVEQLPDGSYKKGDQGVFRTKGVLFGSDTTYGAMECAFTLESAPAGPVTLVLNGVDDPAGWTNTLSVSVNGATVGDPVSFPDSLEKDNTRYLIGWTDVKRTLPAGLLKAGLNTLRIANTRPVLTSEGWTFAAVDHARLVFTEPVKASIDRTAFPIYYYGLEAGPEVNLWPAINVDNAITLVQGGEIQFKFFVTLPDALLEKGKPQPDVTVHILTDADITLSPASGTNAPSGRRTPAGVLYEAKLGRLIRGATPHEGQSLNVFLGTSSVFSDKSLTAWCSLDGRDHLKKTYPIRSVALPPIQGRDSLDLLLSIWGGAIPDEPVQARTYIDMLKRAGFNHMFTGAGAAANPLLKEAGFRVYPRFGWFGGGFKIDASTKAWAAVGPDGKTSDKDLCPIAILENWQHPVAGRYFASAKTAAQSPGVDGLCVDFECAAAWCWCDRCVAKFKEESGLAAAAKADLGKDGRLYSDYLEAGRRRNRDLLMKLREIMRAENPALRYFSLASASDMPAHWWDGRTAGRFSIREMVKFADEIACSGYFYEIPGGLKSVRPLIAFARQAATASGRDVRAGLISPIGTTINENPRYRGVFMKADLVRLEVLLTAAAGGRQLSFFRGDCFDGSHYESIRRAVGELLLLRPYLVSGLDRTADLVARVLEEPARRVALSVSHNMMTRTAWRPGLWYHYDAIQLLKDVQGRERLLLLFNYADVPLRLSVKIGGLFDPRYRLSDFATGKALSAWTRLELESGAFTAEVPPRDLMMVKLESDPASTNETE
jgi:hypothetical protein